MVKTVGSTDRKNRKRRSDKGKRRKIYRGKKVRHKRRYKGRLIKYVSKRKEGDPIKLYFWSIDKMSLNGLHHFNRKVRNHVRRVVYGKNRLRVDVVPEDINNRYNLERFCEDILWQGNFLILMWTHRRNKFHCSPRAVASVSIKETSEGLKARVIPSYKNRSIGRFSWWHKS
jgi:hypothetical protein